MKRRILHMVLTLALCLGLLPTVALAATEPSEAYVWGFGEQSDATLTYGTVPGEFDTDRDIFQADYCLHGCLYRE